MATSELVITEGGRGKKFFQLTQIYPFRTPPKIPLSRINTSLIVNRASTTSSCSHGRNTHQWSSDNLPPPQHEPRKANSLPQYFRALLTGAALNDATFSEINGFKSCLVVMPPGKRMDNPWTMVQAGLFQKMANVGWGPCSVSFSPFLQNFPSAFCFVSWPPYVDVPAPKKS